MAVIPSSGPTDHEVRVLDKNWEFKEKEDVKWLPVAQFPTNVHLDLLHHKKIPDPYFEQNEKLVQWVGEKVWMYRTEFEGPQRVPDGEKVVLAFDGLDTYAKVVLNGTTVLESDNMFIPWRVDVSKTISFGSKNLLEITFDSAWLVGKKIRERYPDHHWKVWNGDASRLVVRKAQYHYGWDWGPMLMTAGPWRPIYLEVYKARIDDLYFSTKVADTLDKADVITTANLEGAPSGSTVTFELSIEGSVVEVQTAKVIESTAQTAFEVVKPELWYPANYGKQALYQLRATLHLGDIELDSTAKNLGIRKAVVVQRELKDEPGTTFFFEVNNIPIFCGGSNWIPADNFLPRITNDRYRAWLKLVRDGNQVMVRVWGGGVYEDDVFYDIADELGILVWQDFMFACGSYPATIESFRKSVEEEARANLKRLRHHASIVIYAGNNEDYQLQESEGLTYDPGNKDADSWLKTNFPARYIYEKILVDATKELTPDTYYHFGSPYGGKDTRDQTIGDLHMWDVWHGTQEKYQDFDKLAGRFVSEFGMEAFPDIRTINSYLPLDSPDRYAQSRTVDFHNKADGHERRIALYLVENFRYCYEPLEQYAYMTQLMQAECLGTAYRLWRRNWKGPGHEYTAGALVWQTNDCWPVTSWAIADYYLRPKLAYHAIKQCLEPLCLGMKREVRKYPRDEYTNAYFDQETRMHVWAGSFLQRKTIATLVLKAFDVVTGEEIHRQTNGFVELDENRTTELFSFRLPTTEGIGEDTDRVVVAAYLFCQEGKALLARYVSWPDVLKYVPTQTPKQLTVESVDGAVHLEAEVPVKGVTLERDGINFINNLADLVPGEKVTIKAEGLKAGESVGVRYYGSQ